jgi:zinc transporter
MKTMTTDEAALRREGAPRLLSSAFLWAFAFADGVGAALADDSVAERLAAADGWVWLHLPLSDQRARSFLERLGALPEPARELILAAEPRVQIQFADDWAYGVLPDIQRNLDGRAQDVGRLQFAFDGRRLVTARRHALQCVDDLRRRVVAGEALDGPAEAWTALVERYIDLSEERLHELSESVDRIEDRLLADDEGLDALALGPLRREVSRQHREFLSLRSALGRGLLPRAQHRVSQVTEQLPRLTHELEDLDREAMGLQERARLLHEEIDTKIAAGANRAMRTLTVMSTLLIPPTLIVGAFGMNLPGMPFEAGRFGFAKASVLCIAVVAGAYVLLRRWRIL